MKIDRYDVRDENGNMIASVMATSPDDATRIAATTDEGRHCPTDQMTADVHAWTAEDLLDYVGGLLGTVDARDFVGQDLEQVAASIVEEGRDMCHQSGPECVYPTGDDEAYVERHVYDRLAYIAAERSN